MHNCLPSRLNLVRRGVTLSSTICPLCLLEESTEHIIFICSKSQQIWKQCYQWLGDIIALPCNVEMHFLQHKGESGNGRGGQVRMILWPAIVWIISEH